jgi:hypothetical protein
MKHVIMSALSFEKKQTYSGEQCHEMSAGNMIHQQDDV